MRLSTASLFMSAALLSLAGCDKPAAPAAGATPQAAAATTPAPPASGPISLENLPHRKAGLWRQTMTLEGSPQTMPATEFCLDAASEAKMSMMGQQMSKDHCKSPQMTRNLDGSITFSSACDFGNRKTVSTGTISGDYNSNYKVVIDSASSGGPAGRDDSEHKMTMTATWEGPCKPGQTGGDIILPDGRTMNMIKGQ